MVSHFLSTLLTRHGLIFLLNICRNCGFNFARTYFDHVWFGLCVPTVQFGMPSVVSCDIKNHDSSSNPAVHGLMWGRKLNHGYHGAFGTIVAFCDRESAFKWFKIGYFYGSHGLLKIRRSKL